jgi:signal peptidase I
MSDRPPKPWLAALLSILQPGLGHLYAWRPEFALSLWGIGLACTGLIMFGVAKVPRLAAFVLLLIVGLALLLTIAWHAFVTARADEVPHRPARWRLALTMLAFVGAASIASSALRANLARNVVEAFYIPSGSMEPTVLDGDWLFVVPRHGAPLARDELVKFRWNGTNLLKRLAALPGDTLAMRGGRLYRDGSEVREPWAITRGASLSDEEFAWQRTALAPGIDPASYHPTVDDWGPLVVPAGAVFVLGDNRHDSLDSRYYGFIATDSVLGIPTYVYFSRDSIEGVRWRRIGHRFE